MLFQRLILLLILLPTYLIAAPAERVISLAPHITELAYAAGLGDKLIAVSEYSDYPPQAKSLEKVSNHQGIKIERIIALQPDLVIAWPGGNPVKELDKLKAFNINLYSVNTKSLEDIAMHIEALSQYAQDPTIGQKAAKNFREQLIKLRQDYKVDFPVSYFYQLSDQPLMTVAKNHWPSEVFSFCGGVNVFKNSPVPYPQVGKEQVILKNPDVIFSSQHSSAISLWSGWKQQMTASQKNYIWPLNSDWLNRPTPRTINALKEVCTYFETVRKQG